MRWTAVLCKHHIGRRIKLHWHVQGKIKVVQTGSEEVLKSQGHEVVDVKDVLSPPRTKEKVEFIGYYDREVPQDENHPDYKAEPCFMYKDQNVLLEGLEQAKLLTNTVEISKGLPEVVLEKENNLKVPDQIHSEVQKKVMLSCVYEATQLKLPVRKDPLRPAWVFARDYGIPDKRKNELLCKNLVGVCEQFTNTRSKAVVTDAFFSTPLEIHKKVQFELTSELVVTSARKLASLADPNTTKALDLPDLHPLDCTISLVPHNFYEMQSIYPISVTSKWPYVQVAFVHLNRSRVKNLDEKELTETQIHERSLMKGFTIAAAKARALFGDDVKSLPEPIVIPVVQTNSRLFHFTIFQLNTLDTKSEIKNIFWNSPRIPLYNACEYRGGRPILEEYNPEVIRKILTFYNLE